MTIFNLEMKKINLKIKCLFKKKKKRNLRKLKKKKAKRKTNKKSRNKILIKIIQYNNLYQI